MTSPRKLLIFGLVLVLVVYGVPLFAGWWFLARREVNYVNPDILPELRAVGRVVDESRAENHEWEHYYAEFVTIVVHIDGAGEGVAEEAIGRLGRSGWSIGGSSGDGVGLESAKWPAASVEVERLGISKYTDEDLREAAAASGLPVEELVSITIQE